MPQNPHKLLIIDDQPPSVGLLLEYLSESHFDIMVALDGVRGLAMADAERPDLVLLDVAMPVLDGFEVCRRLKANPATARIPVIFLSAATGTDDKLLGFACGGADYITKPFSEPEVLARVHVHLNYAQPPITSSRVSDLVGTTDDPEEDRKWQIFEMAISELQDNLAHPPGLIELAHRLGTNERKLTEIFREQVGMTVFDFLLDMRLEKARLMLASTQLQIQQIAERVGYRNAGDFTRAFRRRYTVSPSEYRRSQGLEAVGDAHDQ